MQPARSQPTASLEVVSLPPFLSLVLLVRDRVLLIKTRLLMPINSVPESWVPVGDDAAGFPVPCHGSFSVSPAANYRAGICSSHQIGTSSFGTAKGSEMEAALPLHPNEIGPQRRPRVEVSPAQVQITCTSHCVVTQGLPHPFGSQWARASKESQVRPWKRGPEARKMACLKYEAATQNGGHQQDGPCRAETSETWPKDTCFSVRACGREGTVRGGHRSSAPAGRSR